MCLALVVGYVLSHGLEVLQFCDVTTSAGSAGVVFTSANSAVVNLYFFGAAGGIPFMLPDESLTFCIDTSYSDGGALNPVGICDIASVRYVSARRLSWRYG